MMRNPEDKRDDNLSADASQEKYDAEIEHETSNKAEWRINDHYAKKGKELDNLKWEASVATGFNISRIVEKLKAGKNEEMGSKEERDAAQIREDYGKASWFPMAEALLKAEEDIDNNKEQVKEVRREKNAEKASEALAKKQSDIMKKLKGLVQ